MKVREVKAALGVSRDTLYRYEKTFGLEIARGPNNERIYTEDDVEALGRLIEGADDRMKAKCSDAQSEAIALRKLSPVPKAVSSQVIKERIASILLNDPRCMKNDWLLCRMYYKTYYGTVNIDRLMALTAPSPDTLTRRRREVYQKVLQLGADYWQKTPE